MFLIHIDVYLMEGSVNYLSTLIIRFFYLGVLLMNTFKYHIFEPMGRFQLELIYLYFPPSSHLIYVCFCPVGLSLL